MAPKYRVFISYSTKDLPAVELARSVLSSAPLRIAQGKCDVEVFVAEYDVAPSEPLAARILDAIIRCDLFILFWSSNSRRSEWVPQEIGVARGNMKPILPIVLEQGLELPGFIKDLQ